MEYTYKLFDNAHSSVSGGYSSCKIFCLADSVEQVMNAKTASELNLICSRIFEYYGYDYYVYGTEIKSDSDKSICISSNAPKNLIQSYIQTDAVRFDPRVAHGRKCFRPIYWKNLFHNKEFSRPARAVMDTLWDNGIRSGVSMALKGRGNEPAIMHFARSQNDSKVKEDIFQTLPYLSFLMGYIYETINKMGGAANISENPSSVNFSFKESEILKYVAEGLSTQTIADKFHLSDNAILYHMKNIHIKLGVNSRQHAVAKAISLGLIEL